MYFGLSFLVDVKTIILASDYHWADVQIKAGL